MRTSQSRPRLAEDGDARRVFVLRADLISVEARALLQRPRASVLVSRRGSLAEQLDRLQERGSPARCAARAQRPHARAVVQARRRRRSSSSSTASAASPTDGREYVTVLGDGQWTPAPWINVIANPAFGFQVSVEGGGYTWSREQPREPAHALVERSGERPPGEVLYLRDEDSGELWAPTALPIRDERRRYVARHGQGYAASSTRRTASRSSCCSTCRSTIRSRSRGSRSAICPDATAAALGDRLRRVGARHVARRVCALRRHRDRRRRPARCFARNPWNATVRRARRVRRPRRAADRPGPATAREFLGRNGSARRAGGARARRARCRIASAPASTRAPRCRPRSSCAPGEATEVVFFLGQAASASEARALVARYRAADLDAVLAQRDASAGTTMLGTVQVKTPDRVDGPHAQSLAALPDARLPHLGALGVLPGERRLRLSRPAAGRHGARASRGPSSTREHLLRAAARQFIEGDVQHWWLPHSGQGVRTRISDDRVWLPYAAAHYVEATGDVGVLDETRAVPRGPPLHAGEHEAYFQPMISDETGDAVRALRARARREPRGRRARPAADRHRRLERRHEPRRRGGQGRERLARLVPARRRSRPSRRSPTRAASTTRAARWRAHADALQAALERDGWDGDWYRRGYFDDGTPLGSAASSECRIDSIAQSWSVISGAGDPTRAARAMAAVDEQLVRRGDGLVLLFTPPFDRTPLDPGYIKGYPPGMRENGGQYTHAAVWSVIAFALLGDGDRAAELFSLLNPINHARTRAGVHRYKVEPYVGRRRRLLGARRTSGAAAGPGTRARRAGCIARASSGSSASACAEPRSSSTPASRRAGPASRSRSATAPRATRSRSRTRRGRVAASRTRSSTGETLTAGAPTRIPLEDDGATHRVRVVLG